MLAVVLGMTTILFNKFTMIRDMGNSLSAFYSAYSGLEKTLYFDRKQFPNNAQRGLCSICNTCPTNDCQNCVVAPLANNGCNTSICNNCQVTYTSTFDGRDYVVDAKVTENLSNPSLFDLYINSKGFYEDTMRVVEHRSTQ